MLAALKDNLRMLPTMALILMLAMTGGVETQIPLGEISGRIDHLAFDPGRQRIYIAELGNNSVGIIDWKSKSVLRTVPGFDEPQGIAYEPSTDTIYVANGGDGSVRLFDGEHFAPSGTIPLGKDADNVRVDRSTHRVYVGYGSGALAVIDATSRKRIADIPLAGHPESFQLHPSDDRIFVNVPDAHQIAVVSRTSNRQIAAWQTGALRANFPLVLDPEHGRVITVFRQPARIQAFDMASGRALEASAACGDSDDVFLDSQRHRVYNICGEGFVDVLDAGTRVARVETRNGARTGLYIPEIDRLLVAIRASGKTPAALWVVAPGAQ